MRVVVANKAYSMPRSRFQGLLKIAREQVPLGVYAVEKGDYAQLVCDRCESVTQLKALIRMYKSRGFKVYANGG